MSADVLDYRDYNVGWISALPLELAAAEALLDVQHKPLDRLLNDSNLYVFGRVCAHNVVMACLPAGDIGTISAAKVATQMLRSFPSIRIGLMVGIGGGVPDPYDIRLGDVVVGIPGSKSTGVVQYDYGKTEAGGKFRRTKTLNGPPTILLNAVSRMQASSYSENQFLDHILVINQKLDSRFLYPGAKYDILFDASYEHIDDESNCEKCDITKLVTRPDRDSTEPYVHYGTIASGNQVIKHAGTRDQIASECDALCFEMEAAGLMNDFPCLVVRGISDYADSHKNNRWKEYAAASAAAYAKKLLSVMTPEKVVDLPTLHHLVLNKSAVLDIKRSPQSLLGARSVDDPLWVVPPGSERSDLFVDRASIPVDSILESLKKHHRVVISGLPGIGKTEIVKQLIWRAREIVKIYKGIFWLNAATEASIHSALMSMAQAMDVLGEDEIKERRKSHNAIAAMVLKELNDQDHWLLIFDNADSLDVIRDLMPEKRGRRHVLITSRYREAYSILRASKIHLDEMDAQEAMTLFTSSSGLEGCSGDASQVADLLKELGYLPLAIVQAAGYLRETQDDVMAYTEIFKQSRKEIWDWKPIQDSSYCSVATVMTLSLRTLKRRESSLRLLCLLSFVDPDIIPETLWVAGPSLRDENIREILSTRASLNKALGPMLAYCVIKRSVQNHSISFHRLVQTVIRDIIEGNLLDQSSVMESLSSHERSAKYWAERAIEVVSMSYPSRGPENWPLCEVYNPHGISCVEYGRQYNVTTLDLGILQNSMAHYAIEQDRYPQAIRFYRGAMEIIENEFGKDDANIADTMMNLATAYRRLGNYDKAIEQHQRALLIKQKEFGMDHITTAINVMNLGNVYDDKDDYENAIIHFERALKILESHEGNHDIAADAIHNLGFTYHRLRRYDEACAQYERALAIKEKSLGKNHLDIAVVVNNIGNTLNSQGKFKESIAQFTRALSIYETVLGKDHFKAADTISNMGMAYFNQEKYHESIEYYARALRIKENVLGTDHVGLMGAIIGVGINYYCFGRVDEAIEQYQRALNIRGKASAVSDPDEANTYLNLGIAYKSQGKYDIAKTHFERALQIQEITSEHFQLDLNMTLENLAEVCLALENFDDAIVQYRRILSIVGKAFGIDHVETANVLNKLAFIYELYGKDYVTAISLYERALSIYSNVYSPCEVDIKINIANCYQSLRKYDDAISHYSTALQMIEHANDESPDRKAEILSKLGEVFHAQRKFDEAADMYEKALKSTNLDVTPTESMVHRVICDVCKMEPLLGYRYKCRECIDYDLCSQCINRSSELHVVDHSFLQIPRV